MNSNSWLIMLYGNLILAGQNEGWLYFAYLVLSIFSLVQLLTYKDSSK